MAAGFDAVMAAGRTAVLAGTHNVDAPPRDGGRWGLSAVLLPFGDVADALDRLTASLREVAGHTHWPSGSDGRAHATVRALEPYRDAGDDEQAGRYLAALERAGRAVGPVRLDFTGLALSAGSVMACATTPGGTAHHFRNALGRELGPDGWLEDTLFPTYRDPIWYCSAVHFTGPLRAPGDLVAWVDAHRDVGLGEQTYHSVALCRWTFDGIAMAPAVIGSATLG
jgi:hypothetical protein